MTSPHIFNPRHIAVLEMENRKIWQNPEEILATLKIKRDLVAADLGCGSGFFTIPLSKEVKKVYAIDVQKEMLDFLREKIRRLRIENIEPLLSTGSQIPLEDDSVDLLMSMNTLHEFEDKKGMAKQIRRVLKQDGVAAIADFKKKNTGFGPPAAIRLSRQQAINLFVQSGFTILQTKELKYHYVLTFLKNLKREAPERSNFTRQRYLPQLSPASHKN